MILHLSDLHFGTEKQECVQAIQAFCREHRPEAVVVSGDITQRARWYQFHACKQFLDSLQLPYLIIPGNHDIPLYNVWKRIFHPFSYYQAHFGQTENLLETEHFYVIGINTIRRRHHTRGALSLEQIQKIDQKLQAVSSQKLKIIVAHQPFYVTHYDRRGIKDCPRLAKIALEAWAKHGLYALLHGHLHHAAVYDLNKAFGLELAQPIYDVHAGTATSYRLHQGQPNSFNVIHSNGTIEEYVFNSVKGCFEFKQDLMNKSSK
ncbi:3',5'-cyclic-nucleotide phosphodiesterase [Acinetobacter sp. NCu2D-2]|uniref:metallophosphoesterase family protein n=1 Tax=Acinetobacter sp. NCu2D-2 TaxID=1608473 RepID=UPI0007CDAAB2|nr:metallophosphoesterase [Acinetobacter sp. NCu2D-2]ANF81369.1 3',5'-cyclic-nucleotide phosphodiesterase [Acinetobacter sp. NCu2D-2]